MKSLKQVLRDMLRDGNTVQPTRTIVERHGLTLDEARLLVGWWLHLREEAWAVRPLTGAERQARYRAAHAGPAPVIKVRYRRPADRRSRPQRWHDAVAELLELQADYQQWLDALPESLADRPTADALRALCDFDLSGLEMDPPCGFGRD